MGLTVHYHMTVPADLAEAEAKKIVESLQLTAGRLCLKMWVDNVHPITSDPKTLRRHATRWRFMRERGHPTRKHHVEIPPSAGFLFCVDVGRDCEPLWLGLCRYPKTVCYGGRNVRTLADKGWRFHGFSKTQFASLHGWEHFMRCHCAVVHLLAASRSPDLRVKISDEGDYRPRRSLTKLRENLDQMNGIVAAAAGALRDHFPAAKPEDAVQSPIFAHRQFERLEAEGAQHLGTKLKQLRSLLGRP